MAILRSGKPGTRHVGVLRRHDVRLHACAAVCICHLLPQGGCALVHSGSTCSPIACSWSGFHCHCCYCGCGVAEPELGPAGGRSSLCCASRSISQECCGVWPGAYGAVLALLMLCCVWRAHCLCGQSEDASLRSIATATLLLLDTALCTRPCRSL